ncbi:MAG TPA: ParB/RepB/Spo0J family partition protein [Candidatus Binatia bacterium]|nr:ParB/RepB/Spo0J family partition protein [Candidatus Binatia bacterium]
MELKRKALGRGLGALIPVDNVVSSTDKNEVLLSEIRANPLQPREVFSESGICELAESIRRKGVLQPLVVRRVAEGFELIAGERRFRAARQAGLERVPVVIREASDDELLELALIENIQRENLNPLEEARAYRRLMDEFHLTQDQVAEKVAKDRSTVANAIRLLQLPDEVKQQIIDGTLSAGHARTLLNVGSRREQIAIGRHVATARLSVRETEHYVRKHRQPQTTPDHRALEEQLTRTLGTKVKIHLHHSGRGKIEMQFYSVAELNGLADRLSNRLQAATNF